MVEATVSDRAISGLGSSLRGRIIRPADGDYDQARRVWNGMIDRRPALIVRPAAAADVVAAVNFARDESSLEARRSSRIPPGRGAWARLCNAWRAATRPPTSERGRFPRSLRGVASLPVSRVRLSETAGDLR